MQFTVLMGLKNRSQREVFFAGGLGSGVLAGVFASGWCPLMAVRKAGLGESGPIGVGGRGQGPR